MAKMTSVHIFKKFFLKILFSCLTAAIFVKGKQKTMAIFFSQSFFSLFIFAIGHNQSIDIMPEFLAPLENLTATQGRDVQFTCIVNDLGSFRVSFCLF